MIETQEISKDKLHQTKGKINFTCDQCGVKFWDYSYQKTGKTKFCSHECHSEFLRGKPLKEFHKIYRFKNSYILKVERIMGKNLPTGAVIHHIDLNRENNTNSNLIVCQDDAYHKLLHKRERILRSGGNPNTDLICSTCRLPKDKSEFDYSDQIHSGRCKTCKREYTKKWRRGKNGTH